MFRRLRPSPAANIAPLYYARDHYDPTKYSSEIAEGLAVGAELRFTLPDQFDSSHTIGASTQTLIVGLGPG